MSHKIDLRNDQRTHTVWKKNTALADGHEVGNALERKRDMQEVRSDTIFTVQVLRAKRISHKMSKNPR